MTNTIATYQDLLDEKERLTQLLKAQKELVHADFQELKAELLPVRSAIATIGKMTTRDSSNPLLTGVTNTVIDVAVRNLFLNKAGWLTRMIVPFVMKNFSSHVIADNKQPILKKLFSLFGKKHKMNGTHKVHEEEDED